MDESLGAVCRSLFADPAVLLRQWNWKSALFSSFCRSGVFFAATLPFGVKAATGAMLAEFVYRAFAAGFYGGLTQAFRRVKPEQLATAAVMFGVPLFSHTIEFLLHWLRGTPNLLVSITASFAFTILSTAFNLHAMRRGVLVVGMDGQSLLADMRAMPVVVFSFIASGFGILGPARE